MKNKIEFKNVYKKYDGENVLNNINISFKEKEFITILGPSGCGKTTLLRMINALEVPTEGEIFIDNEDISTKNPITLRRKIGYVIQNAVLFPNMNVMENISYVPNLLSKKEKENLNLDIQKCLKTVNLDAELLDRYPDELSGGQQQRVAIARALAAEPDMILMDEPFSAVDEITREILQSEIKRIQRETDTTILFVTHDVKEALLLGDKILILNKGNIEQFASPKEVLENPASEYVKKLLSINSN